MHIVALLAVHWGVIMRWLADPSYRSLKNVVLTSAVSVSLAGCGGTAASPPSPFSGERAELMASDERGGPDEIIQAEIQRHASVDIDAMALIRRLRPRWLTPRGQNSITNPGSSYPVVYLDEVRHGGLNSLYAIPSSEIRRMEFLSTSDATTRWGTGHPAGVINVVTR